MIPFIASLLLCATLSSARVTEFVLVDAGNRTTLRKMTPGIEIDLATPITIEALVSGTPRAVTFTAPFKRVEKTSPYVLTGDSPFLEYQPLRLKPGRYVVRAFDSDNPGKPLSVPFRVVSKLPKLAPLTFPRTVLGTQAVLKAVVQNARQAGPVTFQWELTTVALGQAEQEPAPLSGETDPTLLIASAQCEKAVCGGRNGCTGLLQYSVKACNQAGCVRSNLVGPNVVAGDGFEQRDFFQSEFCSPFDGEVQPVGGRLPGPRRELPRLSKLVYPRTVLGAKATLDFKVLNRAKVGPYTVLWEVSRTGFGDSPDDALPLKKASSFDPRLVIERAECEMYDCSRVGCNGLLRYNAKVCNEAGCVRTNTVFPDVVAGNGPDAEREFAKCATLDNVELTPAGGRRPAAVQVPKLRPLVFPRSVLGAQAFVRAEIINYARAAPMTFQWEVTTVALGLAEESPQPIGGETDSSLFLPSAQCEKADCQGRNGCVGLLRYSVNVCNEVGCVRSNLVAPNVVAGEGEAAARKFENSRCFVLGQIIRPI